MAQSWITSFTHIEHTGEIGRSMGFGALIPSPLPWIFTSAASVGFSPRSCSFNYTGKTLRTPVHIATKSSRNLSDLWRATIKIRAAPLRSVTEIAPKSPFLPVNRALHRTWYGFRVAQQLYRLSVNIPYITLPSGEWKQRFLPVFRLVLQAK